MTNNVSQTFKILRLLGKNTRYTERLIKLLQVKDDFVLRADRWSHEHWKRESRIHVVPITELLILLDRQVAKYL